MLLIIGVSSMISPITYNASYNVEMTILIIGTFILALFPVIPPKNKMDRINGITFLILYMVYLGLLFNIK